MQHDRQPVPGMFDQIRIETLKGARQRGLTSSSLPADSAPWVRAGLRRLEEGETLTPEALQEADVDQNAQFPR